MPSPPNPSPTAAGRRCRAAAGRERIFAYGSLEVPELMERLAGRRLPASPAVLEGFARFLVRGTAHPGAVAEPGARTEGVLYEGADPEILEVLDLYEGGLYQRRTVRVRAAGRGELRAQAWLVPESRRSALGREPWDRERFVAEHLPGYLDAAARLRRSLRSRSR